MKSALDYFVEYKIHATAEELRAAGYRVEAPAKLGAHDVDLVAEKGPKKVAYVFVPLNALGAGRAERTRLGEAASELGYELHTFVVPPPRPTSVRVDGLSRALQEHMARDVPPELGALAPGVAVYKVAGVEVSLAEICADATHVRGAGAVEFEFTDPAGERDSDDLPFEFDVVLDHRLGIKEIRSLRVDTANFNDY